MISDAALGSAGGHEVALLARQRDRRDPGAVVLRCVERQRTPAAPDVDEVRARRECQLATDEVELARCAAAKSTGTVAVTVAVAGVRPVAAGVRHRVVEQQLVELVGEVVVVRDRGTIALTGVQRAAEASLRGRR
ncbi:MAG: hypothetical protein WKF58_00325 [Ilumatobacteraceae bacterium]